MHQSIGLHQINMSLFTEGFTFQRVTGQWRTLLMLTSQMALCSMKNKGARQWRHITGCFMLDIVEEHRIEYKASPIYANHSGTPPLLKHRRASRICRANTNPFFRGLL